MSKKNIDLNLCSNADLHKYIRRSYADLFFAKQSFLLVSTINFRKDVEAVELLLNLPKKAFSFLVSSAPLRRLMMQNVTVLNKEINAEQLKNFISKQCSFLDVLISEYPEYREDAFVYLMSEHKTLFRSWIDTTTIDLNYQNMFPTRIFNTSELSDIVRSLQKGIFSLADIASSNIFPSLVSDKDGQHLLSSTDVWHSHLHQQMRNTLTSRSLKAIPLLQCINVNVESHQSSTRMLQILRTYFDPTVESCFRARVSVVGAMYNLPTSVVSGRDLLSFFGHPDVGPFFAMINEQSNTISESAVLDVNTLDEFHT